MLLPITGQQYLPSCWGQWNTVSIGERLLVNPAQNSEASTGPRETIEGNAPDRQEEEGEICGRRWLQRGCRQKKLTACPLVPWKLSASIPLRGLGGQIVNGKAVTLPLKIGKMPIRKFEVVVTPIPEWIIGMDILAGMTLYLEKGKFQFGTGIDVRTILVGKVKMTPFPIPEATETVCQKQYRIPGGQEEIAATIREYLEAGVLKPITTKWNNPLWPVKKSDGTWRMTVDYRRLNKLTPALTSAVPDAISIIEKVQHHSGTWYGVIDLANNFEWGAEQQASFELAKEAIQQAVSLGKMQSGPVELQVSALNDYANWSLWQKQVVQGLLTWMPTWHATNWMIHNKEVWGKELWAQIWEKAKEIPITVSHVDAHTKRTDAEALYNQAADELVKVMMIKRESSPGLARWAHYKVGFAVREDSNQRTTRWQLLGAAKLEVSPPGSSASLSSVP
uniref:RNase H type-1 domain-containing protein n=1 Tax=Hippocampus comes TaxID=109280 RepID=A0A3Q2YV57_HIPCM